MTNNYIKVFGLRTYRVVHCEYLLTTCPGQVKKLLLIFAKIILLIQYRFLLLPFLP